MAGPITEAFVLSRVLILGGTAEAATLAHALDSWPELHVITSLAGRTRHPENLPGEMRVGGFGGAEGLASYLRDQSIDALVDATHPFAETISQHATLAADLAGVSRLRLVRPLWQQQPGDHWIDVIDAQHAAKALLGMAQRVFLTTGHRDIEAFADLDDVWFLIRTIEPVAGQLPRSNHCFTARGPFDEAGERTLLWEHRIDAVVTKASGGDATYAKITAARSLRLPVIMIQRPPLSAGPLVHDTDAALSWLQQVTA